MQDLFTQALGIYSPWFVKDVEFNDKQLNIYIDFKRGTRFVDGSDDTKAYSAYDTKMKKYCHMNFFEHECHLHVRVPRIKRDDGKVRLILSPWAGQLNGVSTLRFLLSSFVSTCRYGCQLMNVSDYKGWKFWISMLTKLGAVRI